MPYAKGTVYRIICLIDPKIQYIGSTFNELRWRWQSHKRDYKQYLKNLHSEVAIYPYFKELGIENFKMIKIKDYIVYRENQKDHKHLSAYEQLWINKLKCVNKRPAFMPIKQERKRVENLTPEQREKNNAAKRVANMTEEQKAKKKEKDKNYRANLSDEQKQKNREKRRVENMTEEQKAKKKEKNRLYREKQKLLKENKVVVI